MTPKPPAPNLLTSNWDLDDDGSGATREVDPEELFARAGFSQTSRLTPMPSELEATQQMAAPPVTIRPPMPQDEYVEHMMAMAPASDAGLMPVSPELDEYGTLTPWPASVPPERDPESISTLLFEHNPDALGAGRLPRGLAGGDLEDAVSTTFADVDLSELMPEIGTSKRRSVAPPRIEMDELDELLSDEVKRTVRSETIAPSKSSSDSADDDFGLDLSFDEPVFLSPGDALSPRARSELSLAAIDPRTIELDEQTPIQLPLVSLLPPREPDDDTIEPGPDTMVEGAFPREMPLEVVDESMPARLERLRARFEVGDFSGALVIAEGMLDEQPRHLAAKCYADSCRAMLRQMYMARIGDKAKVLRVVMSPEQIKSLTLDHRTGFLLSCIDGKSTIDEVLDVSGMQPLDALRMLYELIQQGIIEAELPPPPMSRRR